MNNQTNIFSLLLLRARRTTMARVITAIIERATHLALTPGLTKSAPNVLNDARRDADALTFSEEVKRGVYPLPVHEVACCAPRVAMRVSKLLLIFHQLGLLLKVHLQGAKGLLRRAHRVVATHVRLAVPAALGMQGWYAESLPPAVRARFLVSSTVTGLVALALGVASHVPSWCRHTRTSINWHSDASPQQGTARHAHLAAVVADGGLVLAELARAQLLHNVHEALCRHGLQERVHHIL